MNLFDLGARAHTHTAFTHGEEFFWERNTLA